jgi:hypothetical protein
VGKRIVLGGLVGAVLVFVVSAFFHLATNLGETGIRTLPNEAALLPALRAAIPGAGFYFFPGMEGGMKNLTPAQQQEYLAKYKQGPTGILIYSPGGTDLSYGKLLLNQFLFGLVAAFLAAWILGVTANSTTFLSRTVIVTLMGLFAGIYVELPYWNWYNFPLNYSIAYIFTVVVSWLVAGIGMAAIIKPGASPSASAASSASAA